MQPIYHAFEATGTLTSNEQILLDVPLHNKKIDKVRLTRCSSFFCKQAPELVPTLCVGMHRGRSASPVLVPRTYNTEDAERPVCIPTQSVGTSFGACL